MGLHGRRGRIAESLSHLPWALAMVGLSALAGVFVIGLTLNADDPVMFGATRAPLPPPGTAATATTGTEPVAGPPTPGSPAPPGSPATTGPAVRPDTTRPTSAPPVVRPISTTPVVRPPATRPPGPAPTTRPPAPTPGLTGRYRVMNSYVDSFIGEVLVSNASDRALMWTVQLRFGPGVGTLITSWVESAPQAVLRSSGSEYTFTSTATVPARSSVPLRFHFARTGTVNTPIFCTAGGSACLR